MVKRIVPPMSKCRSLTLVEEYVSCPHLLRFRKLYGSGQAFLKGSQGIAGVIWPLFFTAVYYLIFNGILTVLLGRLEKKRGLFQVGGGACGNS